MRLELRPRRRRLAATYVVAGVAALSCRVGYEALPQSGDGGSAGVAGPGGGAGGASAGSGASSTTAGEGTAATAGTQTSGGSPSTDGGVPGIAGYPGATGGDEGAGAPGSAGAPGGAGAANGGAPSSSECQTTADCTCQTFADKSYWFCATAAMTGVAQLECETQGMSLVRIDSPSENDFIFGAAVGLGMLPIGGFVQIGADDVAVDGEWRWHDGTQFWQGGPGGMALAGLYENWLNSSPTNSGIKACAGMTEAGQWQDRSCTAVSPYVCESP